MYDTIYYHEKSYEFNTNFMAKKSYQPTPEVEEELERGAREFAPRWWYSLSANDRAKMIVDNANRGNEHALRWIKRIERNGITKALLRDIQKIVVRIPIKAELVLDEENLNFYFKHELNADLVSHEVWYAVEVGGLTKEQAFDGLKRCALDSCRKYFIGNSGARYCHDNCGAIVRARKMRQSQKHRQAMI